jgi:hypothetical protein
LRVFKQLILNFMSSQEEESKDVCEDLTTQAKVLYDILGVQPTATQQEASRQVPRG